MGVILDHQHRGKPNKPGQFGTAHDLDGDGRQERHETEVWLVEGYIASITQHLTMADLRSVLLCNGYYWQRAKQANAIARTMPGERWGYMACHINSAETPGNYAAIFHDARSRGGKRLAEMIVEQLDLLPELAGHTRVRAASSDRYDRPYSTIKGIWPGPGNISGVCLEPAFINNPSHASLLTHEGLERVGRAISVGVIGWIDEGGQ